MFRKLRIKRKAEQGELSESEWQQAVDEGILPREFCPVCEKELPINKEQVKRDHATCLARFSEMRTLGPWSELW